MQGNNYNQQPNRQNGNNNYQQYGNMNQNFQRMGLNPNAQGFNPNANQFVPGGQQYQQGYGNPYQQGGYGGNPYQQPGYNQQPYQQQAYNQGFNNQYTQQTYNHNQQYNNKQQHQQNYSPQKEHPKEPIQQKQEQTGGGDDDWDDEPAAPTPVQHQKPVEPKPVETKQQEAKKPAEPKQTESIKKVEENKTEEKVSEQASKEAVAPASQPEKETQKSNLAKIKVIKADKLPENMRKSEKEHLNVVFIGHVDAGKSTIGGQIMKVTGMVDSRTLEKFEREAKEKNRESWYLSWALDTNLEERDKGKTVECGRAFFETENKHFSILDAPGHKSFVPNMISGASQADIAVLVISARKGEFEAGFDHGGQTREHAMLVKTAGVKKLIIVINKMDEQTVKWSQARYDDCKKRILKFLKQCGYRSSELHVLPVSGQTGVNILESRPDLHPWYKEESLIKYLDKLPPLARDGKGPVRMPIMDKYRDMGVIVLGKLESGQIIRGQTYTLMPNRVMVKVTQLSTDDIEVDCANAGENLKMKIDGIEEDDIQSGFVICSNDSLCHYSNTFDVKLRIVDYKSIIAAGFQSIMHIHTLTEEVKLTNLICKIDQKTGEKIRFKKGVAKFIQNGDLAVVRFESAGNICIEQFQDFERMGRLTLRDEGKTIAMGTIAKIVEK